MSKPKVFEKPTGVKDYLPGTVAKLRGIETRVLACMERWGYDEIMTPTLEYYDTVGVASSTEDRKLFKLLDRKGTTLVMRSDMTAPIARVVSSLLKDEPLPIRLSYHANVFRAFVAEAGRDAEFYQTGVELVGDASPEADGEVIALAVASLQAAGVERFKLAVGHVGFLSGLFQETLAGEPEVQELLKQSLLQRDHVGYRDQLAQLQLPEAVHRELEGVLRLRGGREVCDFAGQLTRDPGAIAAIAHLRELLEVLEAYGVRDHVILDLTMLGDFSYYSGVIFEGYAAELGFPVVSGGRYDNLLAQFGRPAPATGFALQTNRILEVTARQAADSLHRVLIVYTPAKRADAFSAATTLRERIGNQVETRLVSEALNVQEQDDGYVVNGVPFDEVLWFN